MKEERNVFSPSEDGLVGVAEMLLGTKVLSEMEKWYQSVITADCEYVVFLVRRSYVLALLMEIITKKSMETEGGITVITDAALFLQCEKIAGYYRKYGRFPRILLCDDIMIHGRNMNYFLKTLETRLLDLIPEEDEEEIKAALASAITLCVFTRNDAQLLLLGRYEYRLHFRRREEQCFWRELSSNISELILRSGIGNACYIYSENISDETFAETLIANDPAYVFTSYQNTRQYAWVDVLKAGDKVKAILSVRLVKGVGAQGYRVLPFIFLPNLAKTETQKLMQSVLKAAALEEYLTPFEELWKREGKRTYNELLTLMLSNVILQEFNKKYKIAVPEKEKEQEFSKLARNYNSGDEQKTKEFLKKIVAGTGFGVARLTELLQECLSEDSWISQLGSEDFLKGNICSNIEKYFYERASREEKEAVELSRELYYPTPRRTHRNARGCCFVMRELFEHYTEDEVKLGTAYFLQMMDAGVLSLSSYAPSNVEVVGFAQFAKGGEMSLSLKPLEFYKYIPLLAKMQWVSRQTGRSLEEEVNGYWENISRKGIQYKEKDEVLEFLEKLKQMGQTPQDWDGDYLCKIDLSQEVGEERNGWKEKRQYLEEQYQLVIDYQQRR